MIEVTEVAAKEIIEASLKKGLKNPTLRVGVSKGGCSGLNYLMDIEDLPVPAEEDLIHESNGIKVAMKKEFLKELKGLKVDFGTELNNRGFHFVNPNAEETCGCGTSFNVGKGATKQ